MSRQINTQRIKDHEYHLTGFEVVNCASIDASLHVLYENVQFNPTIMEVSQADHDTLLAEVMQSRCLTRSGEGYGLASRLSAYVNQDTGVAMHVLIRDLPQGTVKLWAEPKEQG